MRPAEQQRRVSPRYVSRETFSGWAITLGPVSPLPFDSVWSPVLALSDDGGCEQSLFQRPAWASPGSHPQARISKDRDPMARSSPFRNRPGAGSLSRQTLPTALGGPEGAQTVPSSGLTFPRKCAYAPTWIHRATVKWLRVFASFRSLSYSRSTCMRAS